MTSVRPGHVVQPLLQRGRALIQRLDVGALEGELVLALRAERPPMLITGGFWTKTRMPGHRGELPGE